MLARTSALRFTARSQTSPDGFASASLRSAAAGAFWPENTATRWHFRFAPLPQHCFCVPLPADLAFATFFGAALADAFGAATATAPLEAASSIATERASQRMGGTG